jgi:APA family basic amino acid/polyamine antiporter
VGLPRLPAETGPDADFSLSAFAVSLVYISLAYSGWNAPVYVGGEVRQPERNLVRSLWLGTAAVTVVYLALNAVFVYSAPMSELVNKEEIGAIAAEALGGSWLRRAISGVVALALFTSISAMIMMGPRVYARMADDGLFPKWLARSGEVPRAAILLQSVLAIAVVWSTRLQDLLGYIGFTLGLSTSLTVVALVRLRLREGAARVPIPGFPVVPIVFVLGTLGAAGFMAQRKPEEAGYGLLTVAAGLPVYWWMRRRR